MPRKALIVKAQKPPKFSTRKYKRCWVCYRSRGKVAKTELCHKSFRDRAYKGLLTGWRKSSR